MIEKYAPVPEGSSQYSAEFIERQGLIKLREQERLVEIGFTEKASETAKRGLCYFHKKPVNFVRIDSAELAAYLGGKFAESAADKALFPGEASRGAHLLDKLDRDGPVINLVNSICIDGIRLGASDIHLESCGDALRVRCRVDGVLRTIRVIDGSRLNAVSSRIKIMANLNILEKRRPQDGRITVSLGDEQVDFRVSIVPSAGGESIVLRILGKKTSSSLEGLGLSRNHLALLKRLLKTPQGLILVTGPTGSGKTTTLNAMIREMVSETLKIITIEDPVEFIVDGVNQIQINEQIGLGFDAVLRRVLRQDPNVIMIGEIRDKPTAEIALRAALTGHLVLSTLHTNDAASVIPRLLNMGAEPYLLAPVLRGAMAQRLLRRLCPHCRETRELSAAEERIFRQAGVETTKLFHSAGCARCGNTGYAGRTLVTELFESGAALEELITRRASMADIGFFLKKQGVKSLLRSGLESAAGGLTSMEEVEREIVLDGESL